MSYEIRADYSESWLLPPALEDWVGPGHPARFVREFVDSIDLVSAGFSARQSADGRPNYAADHLLKVVLYGYMHRIRSLRKLESACHEQMGMIWLTGRRVADHNTLWRFWRDNRKALRQCLRLLNRAAQKADLIGMILHAVDGTKIRAYSSKEQVRTRQQVQEELDQLDAEVEQYIEQTEAAAEREQDAAGFELPAGWEQRMLRREELKELAQQLEVEEREKIVPGEREVRFMRTRSEGNVLAHNAQAVVDEKSGLIVACEVVSEGNDNHALVPMLDEVKENLDAVADQTLADSGYFSGEQIATAERKQYEVLVHDSAEQKQSTKSEYSASRFEYDSSKDCCICPQGKELNFVHTHRGPRGELMREYRCQECMQCPVRSQCTNSDRGRTVRLGAHHEAIRRQRIKRNKEENQRLLSKRKEIIEYPFGLIKRVMEFRRFSVRGREQARLQWSLVCTAFNLQRLYHEWARGKLAFAR